MRQIDAAANQTKKKDNLLETLQKSLGRSQAQKESRAQEVFISKVQAALDDRYTLLQNVILEGPNVPVPSILLGPSGLRVIYATSIKGVYRAKEDVWEKLEDRSQRFQLSRPNLLTRTNMMAHALESYLSSQGIQIPKVEPVLFLSDPGVHVDSARPIVRIVLTDALDRFIAGIIQSQNVLDQNQLQHISQTILGKQAMLAWGAKIGVERDAFSFQDDEARPRPVPRVVIDKSEPTFFQKIPFTRRQWLFLGMITLLNIIILIAFVVVILVSS